MDGERRCMTRSLVRNELGRAPRAASRTRELENPSFRFRDRARTTSRARCWICPASLRTPSCAMGMQTAGVTKLVGVSGCAEVSQKALACAWSPTPIPEPRAWSTRSRVEGSAPSIARSSVFRAFLPRPRRHAGAAAHGENKAKMCDELFKAYKACRKAENAEIVRRRRESRKGMFWD